MIQEPKYPGFYSKFIIALILVLGGGFLSGFLFDAGSNSWYLNLNKSEANPPAIVFPIVWSSLYILMALSLTLFWCKKTGSSKKRGFFLFFIGLGFNFIWTPIFFGLQNPLLALIDIILLFVAVILTIKAFFEHSRTSAFLLLPYLVWIIYAFYLNFYISLHNSL